MEEFDFAKRPRVVAHSNRGVICECDVTLSAHSRALSKTFQPLDTKHALHDLIGVLDPMNAIFFSAVIV